MKKFGWNTGRTFYRFLITAYEIGMSLKRNSTARNLTALQVNLKEKSESVLIHHTTKRYVAWMDTTIQNLTALQMSLKDKPKSEELNLSSKIRRSRDS